MRSRNAGANPWWRPSSILPRALRLPLLAFALAIAVGAEAQLSESKVSLHVIDRCTAGAHTLFQSGDATGWPSFDTEPINDWLAGYLDSQKVSAP